MKFLQVATLGFLLSGVVGAHAATHESEREKTCAALEDAAKTLNLTLPIKINDFATLHSMLVICSAKMVIYTKVLNVHEGELEDGWLKGMRTAWNATMCAAPAIKDMQRKDWKFIDQLYFSDGAIYHVIADCKVKKVSRKKRKRRKRKYVKKK